MSNSHGVVYVATGARYISEAILSCTRLKFFNPNLNVCLFTDDYLSTKLTKCFDIVLQHPCPTYSYRDKLSILELSPFIYTLFLDTDACPIVNIFNDFAILDSFDIAGAYAPVRIPSGWCDHTVPFSFPEINTGVFFFRNSPIMHKFFRNWLKLYDALYVEFFQKWDQASFRSVLWSFYSTNFVVFHILPSEYNFRLTKPWIAGKGLPVSIIHGRVNEHEWSLLIDFLNNDISQFRIFSDWYKKFPSSLIKLKPGTIR